MTIVGNENKKGHQQTYITAAMTLQKSHKKQQKKAKTMFDHGLSIKKEARNTKREKSKNRRRNKQIIT